MKAAPRPPLTVVDDARANRISFDVAQHGQEMPVGLNRKRFEAADKTTAPLREKSSR
jgi:hypothetical protein